MAAPKDQDAALRQHLLDLLRGGNAHATFDAAVEDFPASLRGKKPESAEHTAWQLLEHLRIAQWDILEFSRSAKHPALKWPDDYWPKTDVPPSPAAWTNSVRKFRADLKAMAKLIADKKSDLFTPLPHGDGQTLLREALLLADHNAYHVGQLILLRRLLGNWKS